MVENQRLQDTIVDDLPYELEELGQQIAALSVGNKTELEETYRRVVGSVKRRRRILSLVQEALAQMRLDVKYLVFDLEATRKERDELQERLEEHDPGF